MSKEKEVLKENEVVEEKKVELDIFDKAIIRLKEEIFVRTQNVKNARQGIRANKHASRFFAKPQYEKNGYAKHWVDSNGVPHSVTFARNVMQIEHQIERTLKLNERDENLLFELMEGKDDPVYRKHLTTFILSTGMAEDFTEDELVAIDNAERIDEGLQTEEELQAEIDKLLEDETIENELKEEEEKAKEETTTKESWVICYIN